MLNTKVPKALRRTNMADYIALATECYMCLCEIEAGVEICVDCAEEMNEYSGFEEAKDEGDI